MNNKIMGWVFLIQSIKRMKKELSPLDEEVEGNYPFIIATISIVFAEIEPRFVFDNLYTLNKR